MFFDIEHNLSEMYPGLNPLTLLDFPAEDVFNLINNVLDYNRRNNSKGGATAKGNVIRRPAQDNWF